MQCVFYRNHYSFSDRHQLYYTGALTCVRICSFFFCKNWLLQYNWESRGCLVLSAFTNQSNFCHVLYAKNNNNSVPPNYSTESFNGFGPIYDESLYMFCSSVGNYFLTLSFKSMCWDHIPVQIRWPSCPQNNFFKAKRNTYKLSKITRSHSDIKSICSCFWCFLEFSGRPCWPKTLLPNWLCVREPGSYICLCVCGRVGGERGRGLVFGAGGRSQCSKRVFFQRGKDGCLFFASKGLK